MNKKMPSWGILAATAVFPLILINCAGTVTHPLDTHDPVAYASAVNDMKSATSEIVLRDGGMYRGNIGRVGMETIDLTTEAGHSTKIPTNDVASVSIMDHGLGALRGMGYGALWTGGIIGFAAGVGSGDFIPGFMVGGLVGGLYGGAIGLLTGAIEGARVIYLFPNNASQQIQPRSVISQSIDTTQAKPKNDGDSTLVNKTPMTKALEIHPATQGISPAPEKFLTADQLGRIRILLKDGSEKTSCLIREVRVAGIVYEKNGVLHDLESGKILRIEMAGEGTTRIVVFDPIRKLWQVQEGEK